MANYSFILNADSERIYVNGQDYLKGDVYAKQEGEGYRLYAKDPLYPITTHLNIHTAAYLVDGEVTAFADFKALQAWLDANALTVGKLVIVPPFPDTAGNYVLKVDDSGEELAFEWEEELAIPAPPTTGTKMLVSTDGVLSWEDVPAE